MVKDTQTIRRLLLAHCLSVFDQRVSPTVYSVIYHAKTLKLHWIIKVDRCLTVIYNWHLYLLNSRSQNFSDPSVPLSLAKFAKYSFFINENVSFVNNYFLWFMLLWLYFSGLPLLEYLNLTDCSKLTGGILEIFKGNIFLS